MSVMILLIFHEFGSFFWIDLFFAKIRKLELIRVEQMLMGKRFECINLMVIHHGVYLKINVCVHILPLSEDGSRRRRKIYVAWATLYGLCMRVGGWLISRILNW